MAQISIDRRAKVLSKAKNEKYRLVYLGLFFLLAFAIQAIFDLKWQWLAQQQANDVYAKWSGISLAVYLGAQWILPFLRMIGKQKVAKRFYPLHKQAGVFAPVVFYIHSMEFGYAYLFVLSVVYFANTLLGLFSVDIVAKFVRTYRKQYLFWWMIMHVALSILTMGFMIYHAYIAFAYK